VQRLVDSALDQKEIFGLLRQGEGKVIITASFEDKMQTVRLPLVETEVALWDFMEILFEELRCEMFYSKTKIESKKREHSSDNEAVSPSMPDKKKKVQVNINRLKLKKKEEKQSPLHDDQSSVTSKQNCSPGGSPSPHTNSSNGNGKRLPIYHNAHKLHQAQQAARNLGTKTEVVKPGSDNQKTPPPTLTNGDKASPTNDNAPPLLTPVISSVNPLPTSPTMPILSAAMPFPKYPLPPSSLSEKSFKNSLPPMPSSCSSPAPPILTVANPVPKISATSMSPSQTRGTTLSGSNGYTVTAGSGGGTLLQTTVAPAGIVSLSSMVTPTPTLVGSSAATRLPPPIAQQHQVIQNNMAQAAGALTNQQQQIMAAPSNLVPQHPNVISSYIIPNNTSRPPLPPPQLPAPQQQQIQHQFALNAPQFQAAATSTRNYFSGSLPLQAPVQNSQIQATQVQPKAVHQVRPTVELATTQLLSSPPTPAREPLLDPSSWDIEETISSISSMDPSLAIHVEAFRTHEIDGNALLLLDSDMMMKYLGLKLGPALKISNIIDKLKGKKHLPVG